MALRFFFVSNSSEKKKNRVNAGVSSNTWTDPFYLKSKYGNIRPEGNLKQYLRLFFFCHSFAAVLAVS